MNDKNYLLAIDNGTQSVRALLFDLQGNLLGKGKVEAGGLLLEASGLGRTGPRVLLGDARRGLSAALGPGGHRSRAHPRGVADHPAWHGDPRRCRGQAVASGDPLARPAPGGGPRAHQGALGLAVQAGRRRGRGGAFPRPGRGQLGGPGAAGDRREDRQGVAAFRLSQPPPDRPFRRLGGVLRGLPAVRLQAPALGRAARLEMAGTGGTPRAVAGACSSRASGSARSAPRPAGTPAFRKACR